MEVLNARASFLSNYEVLSLLRELDNDYLSRARAAVRVKKEEESAGAAKATDPSTVDISENLRTIELEAIQYLSADYQPSAQQSEAGIQQLVLNLAPYSLTKAETLQVVNLAPVEAVELYVVVEELEDRLGNEMDNILSAIRKSLDVPTPTPTAPLPLFAESSTPEPEVYQEPQDWREEIYDANEMVFDDTGEGAGVDGDLDMDDD